MYDSDVLVSVIVPFHNEERWLAAAVESILVQDHSHIEVILIDDRSDDDSLKVAKNLSKAHSRVTVTSSTRTPGPAGTRNTGLVLAQGKMITYLDADDLMAPGRISTFVSYLLEHPSCDIVFGQNKLLIESGVLPPSTLPTQEQGQLASYAMSMLHTASTLDVVGGFEENFFRGEDGDWLARARVSGCKIDITEHLATIRRMHGNNISYGGCQSPLRSLSNIRKREKAALGHRVSFETGTAPVIV